MRMRQKGRMISNCEIGFRVHRSRVIVICQLFSIYRPKNKFVRVTHDDFYSSDIHQLTSAPARSQQACAYDMDDVDLAWLNRVNAQRSAIGI